MFVAFKLPPAPWTPANRSRCCRSGKHWPIIFSWASVLGSNPSLGNVALCPGSLVFHWLKVFVGGATSFTIGSDGELVAVVSLISCASVLACFRSESLSVLLFYGFGHCAPCLNKHRLLLGVNGGFVPALNWSGLMFCIRHDAPCAHRYGVRLYDGFLLHWFEDCLSPQAARSLLPGLWAQPSVQAGCGLRFTVLDDAGTSSMRTFLSSQQTGRNVKQIHIYFCEPVLLSWYSSRYSFAGGRPPVLAAGWVGKKCGKKGFGAAPNGDFCRCRFAIKTHFTAQQTKRRTLTPVVSAW